MLVRTVWMAIVAQKPRSGTEKEAIRGDLHRSSPGRKSKVGGCALIARPPALHLHAHGSRVTDHQSPR